MAGAWKKNIIIGLALLPAFAALIFIALPIPRGIIDGSSAVYLSDEGAVLHVSREKRSGAYREWISLEDTPPLFAEMVLSAEDRRFRYHPGIDPVAIARAALVNLRAGRIVSGASTITQQTVRLVWADFLPRNRYLRKICELFLALRLEAHYSKDEILEAYLNLIPFRNNRIGIAAASREMFGRETRHLTREEGAAMALFIRRSGMSRDAFLRRFIIFYGSLIEGRLIPPPDGPVQDMAEQLAGALFDGKRGPETAAATRVVNRTREERAAPHFIDWFRMKFPEVRGQVKTTLSANLNRRILGILRRELQTVEEYGGTNGAVIVIELPRDSRKPLILRAMVGSVDYYSGEDGQVNGALAVRSAGSTLKPFIFALAMDLLGIRPWSTVEDREMGLRTFVDGETFRPRNYDLRYWGPMTVRDALATSRNIPAVDLMRKLGEGTFYRFLSDAGFDHLVQGPDVQGPGMVLGSAGASLLQLSIVYGALAGNGELRPLKIGCDENGNAITVGARRRLVSERSALLITHILADREARRRAFGKRNFQDFPFDVASKTGTSSDYRDAWIIGYTTRHIVGVWVGDFSGKKMRGVSGGWGAGRIFHQVMRDLVGSEKPRFSYPLSWKRVSVCRASGRPAGVHCPPSTELLPENETIEGACPLHAFPGGAPAQNITPSSPEIVAPLNGEVFLLDPHQSASTQQVPLSIRLPSSPAGQSVRYAVNGGPKIPVSATIRRPLPLGPGAHTVTLFVEGEAVQSVRFQVVR